MLDALLVLRTYIEDSLQSYRVIICNRVGSMNNKKNTDNGKSSLAVYRFNDLLISLALDIIGNKNVGPVSQSPSVLHLTSISYDNLLINFIKKIKILNRNWYVIDSFLQISNYQCKKVCNHDEMGSDISVSSHSKTE